MITPGDFLTVPLHWDRKFEKRGDYGGKHWRNPGLKWDWNRLKGRAVKETGGKAWGKKKFNPYLREEGLLFSKSRRSQMGGEENAHTAP